MLTRCWNITDYFLQCEIFTSTCTAFNPHYPQCYPQAKKLQFTAF
jgi:hypothetical protein